MGMCGMLTVDEESLFVPSPYHPCPLQKALKHHSCNPNHSPFLGNGYCNMQCKTMSELDGTAESKNSYKADIGCCDTFGKVITAPSL